MPDRLFHIVGCPAVYGVRGHCAMFDAGPAVAQVPGEAGARMEAVAAFEAAGFKHTNAVPVAGDVRVTATGDRRTTVAADVRKTTRAGGFAAEAGFEVLPRTRNWHWTGVGEPEAGSYGDHTGIAAGNGIGTAALAPRPGKAGSGEAVGVVRGVAEGRKPHYLQIIQTAGAASGLAFCLDPGSSESYDPSAAWNSPAQRIRDLTGQGNDFWRGSSNAVEAIDPVFNGTVGGMSASEFFSLASNGQYFQAAAGTYDDAWQLGTSSWTYAAVILLPIESNRRLLFSNLRIVASRSGGLENYWTGIRLTCRPSFVNVLYHRLMDLEIGSGWDQTNPIPHRYSAIEIPNNTLCFVAVVRRASGNLTFRVNTAVENEAQFTPAGVSDLPSPLRLFGSVINGNPPPSRLYAAAMWSRGLSNAELNAIYAGLKPRFPSLP